MAFQKTPGNVGDVNYGKKYVDCVKGEVIVIGTLSKVGLDQFGNPTYFFRLNDGKIKCLNSAGHLNHLMEQDAAPGKYCRITYDGKVKLTSGAFKGKDSHQFILEIDDEQSTEAPEVTEDQNIATEPTPEPQVASDPGPVMPVVETPVPVPTAPIPAPPVPAVATAPPVPTPEATTPVPAAAPTKTEMNRSALLEKYQRKA